MKRLLIIPQRVVTLLQENHARNLKVIMMVLVLITALYTKEYKGEYELIIHNHIGGILYVFFGSLLFSAFFPHMKFWYHVLIAFSITSALEFIQYFQIPFMVEMADRKVFAYLFGMSFNPMDFVYYLAGGILSLLFLKILEK